MIADIPGGIPQIPRATPPILEMIAAERRVAIGMYVSRILSGAVF
jgi:hypothetical protein